MKTLLAVTFAIGVILSLIGLALGLPISHDIFLIGGPMAGGSGLLMEKIR